jgi:hypothetical protein
MRKFLLLGFLIPFTITCFLEPHIEVDRTGVCFSGLQEHENQLKKKLEIIEIISGFQNTIVLDSIVSRHQIKFLISIDTGCFENSNYEISIKPEAVVPSDNKIDDCCDQPFPCLDVTVSTPYRITRTKDTVTATLTFTSNCDSYDRNMTGAGICKLHFKLLRSVMIISAVV